MALHKLLVDDFDDEAYSLIAIHCNLEDYRMVYLLNQFLKINLKRCPFDLDFEYTAANYSIYEWEDYKKQTMWNLISNICKKEEDSVVSSGSLFDASSKVIKRYNLIPEYEKVNYFLKIENDMNNVNIKDIIIKIQKIPQVVTVYDIDTNTLKSKNNLIFN
ncbi:MAG: IPExxxVDY family protein [Bacteroidetes bacterium]|nr:MAG: IPExxxVDY family protein [Bacteroidota bacterium]